MGWSREELEASVKAYQEMLRPEHEEQKLVKTRIYEDLSWQVGTTWAACGRRMHNISYVYSLRGRQWGHRSEATTSHWCEYRAYQ